MVCIRFILEIFEDIEPSVHGDSRMNRMQTIHSMHRARNPTLNDKSQIVNNIRIPHLELGEEPTIRKEGSPKRTTKKSSVKHHEKDKNILPKNLVTDRTVPLYQGLARLQNNLSVTDRSNLSNPLAQNSPPPAIYSQPRPVQPSNIIATRMITDRLPPYTIAEPNPQHFRV